MYSEQWIEWGFEKDYIKYDRSLNYYFYRKPDDDETDSSDDDEEGADMLDKNIEGFKLAGSFLCCLTLTYVGVFSCNKTQMIIELTDDAVSLSFRAVLAILTLLAFGFVAYWRRGVDNQNNLLNSLNMTI